MSIFLNKISYSYEKDYPLFKEASFKFERGGFYAILGPSGCGKTTLLHILAGLLQPHKGEVLYDEVNFFETHLSKQHKMRKDFLSFIFARPFLISELSVIENLMLNEVSHREELSKLSHHFDIKDLLTLYPHQLSSGQQQRVSCVRALLSSTPFILADEPTAHLDKKRAETLIESLKSQAKELNRGCICVTHDRSLIHHFDQVINLDNSH